MIKVCLIFGAVGDEMCLIFGDVGDEMCLIFRDVVVDTTSSATSCINLKDNFAKDARLTKNIV